MSYFSLNPNLCGIVAMVLWSLTAVLLAFTGSIPPFQLVVMTMLIASAAILVEQIITGKNIRERWVRPLNDYLFVAGGIGTYIFLYYFALKTSPLFEANIINYLWPLLLAAVLHLLQHEAFKPYQYIGFVLGFLGCVLLFIGQSGGGIFSEFHIGYIAAFIAALAWALYSGLAKTKTYPVGFMALVFLVLGLLAIIPHLLYEQTVWPHSMIQWLAIFGLGTTRVAVVGWDYGVKYGNRTLLASLSYLIPVPSFLFLYIFGFGPQAVHILLSAVLVVFGIIITNWPEIYRMRMALRKNDHHAL